MGERGSLLTHPTYRADIDGLRAVAILVVIAFHAFPWRMPGGFIGVDIFFVISGFLISTIIFSSLERNRFSLTSFYSRRIRRIFPALVLVLLSCLVLGWVALFHDEYRQLGKHSFAGASFIQNFILRTESGYFESASQTKPLLHLWSLAIEEQFYIFWPLLMAFVWRRRWSFLRVTMVIAVVSFTANIILIEVNPTSAFYLPVSRFWELMLGGALSYIVLHRPHLINRYKNGQSFLGFSLLLIGLGLVREEKDFPGFWAMLPTVGAFFVISAGPNAWLNQKLLANKLMVGIGLISYPLYLWHWPLLSFLTIHEGKLETGQTIGAVVVAFVLAWLTYRFVEAPLRFGRYASAKVLSLLSAITLIAAFGLFSYKTNGLEGVRRGDSERFDFIEYFENSLPERNYAMRVNLLQKWRGDCDFYDMEMALIGKSTQIPRTRISESCYVRDYEYRYSVLLWGDSNAQMLYPGLRSQLPQDWQILMGYSSGCLPSPDVSHPSSTDYCTQSNWFAMQTIVSSKPDVVIVAQRDGHSLARMNRIAEKLNGLGVRKVIFTGPAPHWNPTLPKVLARRLWETFPRRTYVGSIGDMMQKDSRLKSGFQERDGAVYVSLIDLFCNLDGCLTYVGDDKKEGITSFDREHLTPASSKLAAKERLVGEIVSSTQ
jgi:peptidoglycan/LPS O-acetylase OafA/YrhL